MTRKRSHPCPIDHPEIVAIALDIMLVPARRVRYSPLVLTLADAAIDQIRRALMATGLPVPIDSRSSVPLGPDPLDADDDTKRCLESSPPCDGEPGPCPQHAHQVCTSDLS